MYIYIIILIWLKNYITDKKWNKAFLNHHIHICIYTGIPQQGTEVVQNNITIIAVGKIRQHRIQNYILCKCVAIFFFFVIFVTAKDM